MQERLHTRMAGDTPARASPTPKDADSKDADVKTRDDSSGAQEPRERDDDEREGVKRREGRDEDRVERRRDERERDLDRGDRRGYQNDTGGFRGGRGGGRGGGVGGGYRGGGMAVGGMGRAGWGGGGRGGLGGRLGGPVQDDRMEPVDREKVCPMLLRIFCKFDNHHDDAAFSYKTQPLADEVRVHTWRDATFGELTELLAQVRAASTRKREPWSLPHHSLCPLAPTPPQHTPHPYPPPSTDSLSAVVSPAAAALVACPAAF